MTAESPKNYQPLPRSGSLKVAVLMGGVSEERDISIQSGRCIAQALEEAGLNVVAADIQPDNIDILEDESIDVFFIALHGRFGEDGQLQQIMQDKSLVYTGSGPAASRLAFNKSAGKKCFDTAGIKTPGAVEFDPRTEPKELEKQLRQLSQRFVVKPLRQGSTIGITIVDGPKAALAAARDCQSKFGDCMIEQYIGGREITVGILENQALPIIEIKSKTGFYNYEAKYLDKRTEFLFDTIDEPALEKTIKQTALECFQALGCRHFARVDFILSENRQLYALELNTIPGFTAHSLLPRAAQKAGISMSRLCTGIVSAALESNKPKYAVNHSFETTR